MEGGASFVTIERVAERSGVAKTTIYRHWDSRSQVLFDAFAGLVRRHSVPTPEGSLRDRLIFLANSLTRGLTNSPWAPVFPSMIDAAERDSELDELVQGLLADSVGRLREALVEARAAGELRPDIDLDVAVSVLAGPLFYRRLVSREVIDPRYAERLVDHFLRGAWAG